MTVWLRNLSEIWLWEEVLLTSLIILVAWATSQVFVFLVERVGRRWARRTASTLDDYILEAIQRPASLLILLLGLYTALHRYTFRFLGLLDGLIFVLGVGLVIHMLVKILVALVRWYGEWISREREAETLAREMLPLADKAGKIVLYAIGLVVVLDHFGIEIRSILVTLGIGSLAIGLALQDTLANMFGGFTLMLDRPFRVGDRIQLSSGEVGDVESIGIRSTRLLTPDANLLILPNAHLVKTLVTNHSFPTVGTRVIIEVGVGYGTDTEKAKLLMLEAANQHPEIKQSPKPVAFFKSFGDSALILMLVCHTSNFRGRYEVIDAVNSAVNAKFKAAGIEIPFPVRTVHLHGET